MRVVEIKDRQKVYEFLTDELYLNLYSIADLDDFYWEKSTYFGLIENGEIQSLALYHTGLHLPIITWFDHRVEFQIHALTEFLAEYLPDQVYGSFTQNLKTSFENHFLLESQGKYFKMGLVDEERLRSTDTSAVVQLIKKDVPDIEALFKESYEQNWFEPHMLNRGCYYGIKVKDRLVSMAGTHVYSKEFGVSAIGNVTTHPQYRRMGLGLKVITATCLTLLDSVSNIGLNVQGDNAGAIKCYEKLGFGIAHDYEEIMMRRK